MRHIFGIIIGGALLGGLAACGGGSGNTGGSGPTTTTSETQTGGKGGAAASCTAAGDCGTDTACRKFTCEGGACKTTDVAEGTAVADETQAGDCKKTVCDGKGATTAGNDDADAPDDGTACTVDTCAGGVASQTDAPVGTACTDGGGKKCDGAGKCVACLNALDCGGAGATCQQNMCVASACANGMKDMNETDKDCGGPSCAACAAGLMCLTAADCASGVCTGMVCQAPSCTDGKKNGTETDVDCGGGTCPTCPDGEACKTGADCQSGTCSGLKCKSEINGCDAATATDLTAQSSVTITFTLPSYTPNCIKVKAGTTVTFNGSFSAHPLKAGKIVNNSPVPDAAGASPLPTAAGGLTGGSTATFTMSPAGGYGYYCTAHFSGGMTGAIFVVP